MIELMVVGVIVGTIWFLRRGSWRPLLKLKMSSQGFQSPLVRRGLLLGVILAGVFIIFFTNLPTASWNWVQNTLGERFEQQFGEGTSVWMWPVILIGLVLIWNVLRPRKGGQRRIRGTWGEEISAVLIFGTAAILVVGVALIILDIFGVDDSIKQVVASTKESTCTSPRNIGNNYTVSKEGKCLLVTAQDKSFVLFAKDGRHRLIISVAGSSIQKYPELMENRKAQHFIRAGAFLGPEGQRFSPKREGFRDAGIEAVEVVFKSVPR